MKPHATFSALILAGCTLVVSPALARDSGFEMGARFAFAPGFGEVSKSPPGDLGDFVNGELLFVLDPGYRLNPQIFLGGYIGLGLGLLGEATSDGCDLVDADCFALATHFGFQAQFHLLPGNKIDPWAGGGLGLETLTLFSSAGDDDTATQAYLGAEFMLQGGVDFELANKAHLGPFVGVSVGRYVAGGCDGNACVGDGEVDEASNHGWFLFGVRGTFGPF